MIRVLRAKSEVFQTSRRKPVCLVMSRRQWVHFIPFRHIASHMQALWKTALQQLAWIIAWGPVASTSPHGKGRKITGSTVPQIVSSSSCSASYEGGASIQVSQQMLHMSSCSAGDPSAMMAVGGSVVRKAGSFSVVVRLWWREWRNPSSTSDVPVLFSFKKNNTSRSASE